MKATTNAACMVAICLAVFGCSQPETQQAQVPSPTREAPATFVNKVWRVTESTGMSPGQLVVFLSDSTLVFASRDATPAFGRWTYRDGNLLMVEEGVPYATDIVSVSSTELRLRSHNPGGFVETTFVPAEEPLPAPGT